MRSKLTRSLSLSAYARGDCIRTTTRTLSQPTTSRLGLIATAPYRRIVGGVQKRSKKRIVRYAILAANVIILVAVLGFVLRSSSSADTVQQSAVVSGNTTTSVNPLDQLSSADIAVHIAREAGLEEATSVANKADTVNAQLAVTPAESTVVAKPQIVATALKSRKDIKTYVTQQGDTVSSVAAKFSITSDTVRNSNGLTGDALPAGKSLIISPVSGIVYKVQPGDTAATLASKFNANADQITAFNDAEVSGLPVGQYIVIPDGVKVSPRANTAPSTGFAWGGFSAVYSGNGYDYGYCTWWAAYRRAQIGRPVPSNLGNASTWKVLAQRAGLTVGNQPQGGAVIWFPPRDYYGHVGFVESVNPDGSANISEMNAIGWGKVDYKTIPADQVGNYSYIY